MDPSVFPERSLNDTSGSFRTLNGLPICFWCKRVGHVKKYCRWRWRKCSTAMGNHDHNYSVNQKTARVTATEDYPRDYLDPVKMSKEPDHRIEQAQVSHDNSFSALSRACLKLKQIVTELLQQMEPQAESQAVSGNELEEDEAILIKGVLLNVVKKIGAASKMLDPPLIKCLEKIPNDIVAFKPVLPISFEASFGHLTRSTPPETWIT